MNYKEKFKNPKWQKKRLEILERDDFKCQLCHSQDHTLTVHHFKYSKEPWETPDKFLITVCWNCHKKIQNAQNVILDAIRNSIASSTTVKKIELIYSILDELEALDDDSLKKVYNIMRNINEIVSKELEDSYADK